MKICAYIKRNADGSLTKESQKLMDELNNCFKHWLEHAGTVDAAENADEKEAGTSFSDNKPEAESKDTEIKEIYTEDISELEKIIRSEKPDAVVFPSNDITKELAPRLAVKLDCGLSQDCFGAFIGHEGLIHWLRPVYDNTLLAETVKAGGELHMGSLRLAGSEQTEKWTKDLPIDDAEIVICVGRGCGSGEGLRLAEELAEVLGAAIGATRAVTEAHILPISKQIGQTGKYIRPRIYIGVGVAGAIQHLAGMRNSDIIIAINKDARAPIFEQADYGIVGDLFEVLPRMIEVLREKSK